MPRVANFTEITKIATMFIKATFKDSKKVTIRYDNFPKWSQVKNIFIS